MDSEMSKLNQLKRLMEITHLVMKSGVCPESPRKFSEWFSLIREAHRLGYLYVGFCDDAIDLAVIAYRVSELNDKTGDDLPKEESGNILYVSIASSISKDRLKMTRLLRVYLEDNPSVEEIAYHNHGKLKRFHLRSRYGQTIEA